MAGNATTIVLRLKGTADTKAIIAGLNKIEQKLNKVGTASNKTGTQLNQTASKATKKFKSFQKVLAGVGDVTRRITNQFLNMANGIRLMAQGLMTVGKSFTIFASPAAVLFLKSMLGAAIEFEHALVRVAKTTGFSTEQMDALETGIRKMGISTSTSQADLAKMAEQLGQVGVRGVPQILALVDLFNMLTIATDLTADEVGIAMGRIASAFGIDLNTEKGVQEITKLANVVNRLENEFAADVPSIIAGMENISQLGAMLDFPPQIAAALITALVAVGYSGEEAGTGVRNLTYYLTKNAAAVAGLMGQYDQYNTKAKLLSAINEDVGQTIVDIIHATSEMDEQAQALVASIAVGGIRGGKALASTAGGFEILDRALQMTAEEWEHSTSLINEYNRAMQSTQNQLGILKNNWTELGLTIGDTFLPVINKLITLAVPAVRMLTDAFRALDPNTQKLIIAGIGLVAILGPLLLIFSQMSFGLSMMAMGVGRLAQVFLGWFSLAAALFKLFASFGILLGLTGGQGLALAAILIVVLGAVGAVATAILIKVTGIGDLIAGVFISLGKKAKAWGENLIAEYGKGMLASAVQILSKVLTAIGNFIGRFLAGHSPPDVGPLSHIDKWGQTVFDAYLSGFANADFGILNQVGKTIGRLFATFAKIGKIGKKVKVKFIMEARQNLAKLIKVFNKTGKISEPILKSITKHLGNASDEIEKLIRLWLDYNRIQKEIAELQAQREEVLTTYEDEIQLIAASTMSAEEKADAIRKAMRSRDEELRIIAKEEKMLDKQLELAESQLDMQKQLIAAMQDQDDLQLSLLDTLNSISGKLDALGDIEFPKFPVPTDEDTEKWADAVNDMLTLEDKFEAGKSVIEGFLASLRGEEFDVARFNTLFHCDLEMGTDFAPTYTKMYDMGKKLFGVWDSVRVVFEKIKKLGGLEPEKMPVRGGERGIRAPQAVTPEIARDRALAENVNNFTDAWDTFKESFGEALPEIEWGDPFIGLAPAFELVKSLAEGILFVGEMWLVSLGTLLLDIGDWLINLPANLEPFWIGAVETIGTWWENINESLNTWAENVDIASILQPFWDSMIMWFGDKGEIIGTWFTYVFGTGLENLKTWFDEQTEKVIGIDGWLIKVNTWIEGRMVIVKDAFVALFTTVGEKIAAWLLEQAGKLIGIAKWLAKIATTISEFDLTQAGKDLIGGLIGGIKLKQPAVISSVLAIGRAALRKWNEFWGTHSPSTVMMEGGMNLVLGVVKGIEQGQDLFGETFNTAFAPMKTGLPTASPVLAGAGGLGSQITLNFGKDSVRSDEDIEEIASAVERVLADRAEATMSMGSTFGEGI